MYHHDANTFTSCAYCGGEAIITTGHFGKHVICANDCTTSQVAHEVADHEPCNDRRCDICFALPSGWEF